MRKSIFALILLLTLLPLSTTYSQEVQPKYAFAYGLEGGEVRVAMLMPDDVWVQNTIPARVLFGAADVELALPEWSSDGLTLYVTTVDPVEKNLAVTLEAYDILTNTLTPVLQVVEPENLEFPLEYVRVDSISPDERYAWVTQIITYQTHLIDLQNKTIVTISECPANVLTWQPESIIVACNGRLFAEPQIFRLNLTSGERMQEFVPPSAETGQAAYVQQGRFIEEGRYLVGPLNTLNPAAVGLLQSDEYAAHYFGVGTQLQVNADETYLAFVQNERLWRVNLDTLKTTDTGVISGPYRWENETLHFWRTQTTTEGVFEIVRVEASRLRRVENLIYSGIPPTSIEFSPTDTIVALEFQPEPGQSYVEVHGTEGLIWVSDFEYPGSFVQLQAIPDRLISWSGDWLHLQYAENLSVVPRTLSVNVKTGESIPAPEPQAKFVSASPDGVWWLYVVIGNPFDNLTNRLLAYRHVDNTVQVLAEGVPLYENPQFPLWRYFEWSQN